MGTSFNSNEKPIPYQRVMIQGAYFKLIWREPMLDRRAVVIIGKCIGINTKKKEYPFELVWTESVHLKKLQENFPANTPAKFAVSFDHLSDYLDGDRGIFERVEMLEEKEALTYEL